MAIIELWEFGAGFRNRIAGSVEAVGYRRPILKLQLSVKIIPRQASDPGASSWEERAVDRTI
jgi:hypothetical protein